MSRSRTSPSRPIAVEVDGQIHAGDYYVSGRSIYVYGAGGFRRSALDGFTPEVLARMLLRELVEVERDSRAAGRPDRA